MRDPNSDPISVSAPEVDLAEIEKRAAAATAGPWVEGYVTGRCSLAHQHGFGDCQFVYRIETDRQYGVRGKIASVALTRDVLSTTEEYGLPAAADIAFMAAARTDVPVLVAEVHRLRAQVGALERGQVVAIAALAEANRELGLLHEAVDLMDADGERAQYFKDRALPEDPLVLALCLDHGFGAVIDSACRQWFLRDPSGAFVQGPCAGTVRIIRDALKVPA